MRHLIASRPSRRTRPRVLVLLAVTAMLFGMLPATAGAQTTDDPRFDLGWGFLDAEEASAGLDVAGRFHKQDGGFFDPGSIGNFGFLNSDIAFTGHYAIQGNFAGFQIFDISDPSNPTLRTEVLCPGGQGDPNIYGDLLFISVEENRGRVDCGTQGNPFGAQPTRFRGVRIFDISDIDNPVQVGGVQLCRGSHTHRLVEDVDDPSVVYIYNSGTAGVRSSGELARCNNEPADGPDPARWMTEIIRVPVDAPQDAEVVNEARLFVDPETGRLDGLQNGPTQPRHPSGSFYSPSPNTNTCHDITAYPEIGLAAGACQGNGLLIDISDPANPVRLDAVADVNFSYWHSANFNNDGSTVMFTDEWGGGTQPRCRPDDELSWGADAIYEVVDTEDGKKLEFASYYKMPVVQTNEENCVAHQANLLPVPGRDIFVQAWYQGGLSMVDLTDPANPVEIGYFDRGPINDTSRVLGGFWSGYWYNGQVFGSEIARGLDVFDVLPTEHLTENEIAAAKTVVLDEHNAMAMRTYEWEPSFPLVRAYRDQLVRAGGIDDALLANVDKFVDRAERFQSGPQRQAAIATLRAIAGQLTGDGQETLAGALRDLADSLD